VSGPGHRPGHAWPGGIRTIVAPLAAAEFELHAWWVRSPDGWVSGNDDGDDDEPPDTAGHTEIDWLTEVALNGYMDQVITGDTDACKAEAEPGDLADDGTLAEDPRSSGLGAYFDPTVAGEVDPTDDAAYASIPVTGAPATMGAEDGIAEADTARGGGADIPDPDEEELPVAVVQVTSGPLIGELLPGEPSWTADGPVAEYNAADRTADSADAGQETLAGHGEERTPLDVGLELMALEKEKASGTPRERQPGPAMPETGSREPDAGTPVPTADTSGTALVSADPDAIGHGADGPVTLAEPGGDEKPATGTVAEPPPVGDLQPPGNEEAVLQRAGDILAAVESSMPPAAPDSGRHDAPSLPAPSLEAGPAPTESVTAAAKEILEHAVGGGDGRGEPAADNSADQVALVAVAVAAIIRDAPSGQIIDAIRALTSDPATFEELRRIADNPGLSAETIREVTRKARLSGGDTAPSDGKLIVGVLLLLAAGIMVPVLAGAALQVILTNEIAIASLAVAVAALRKSS
jgi:hypothetical protein